MKEHKSVTNLIELIGERQVRDALILCGCSPAWVQAASDYEMTEKLLESMPMRKGYRETAVLEAALKSLLRVETMLPKQQAEKIWRFIYQRLLSEARTQAEWSAMFPARSPETEISDADMERLYAERATVAWLGNGLLCTSATTWHAWEEEMTAFLQEKCKCGEKKILFRIPSDYVDVSPNVYAVEQCLQKTTRDCKDEHLLLSQAIRFFSVHGSGADLCVIFDAASDVANLTALLKRMEKVWKSPTLWLMSSCEQTDRAVIDWMLSCEDPMNCRLAIDLSDLSKETLRKRLSSLAAYYPIGRVMAVQTTLNTV